MPVDPENEEQKRRDPNAPGGYEGFDAYFNANKGAAQASAGRYADQARQSVTAAQQALQTTQGDFQQQTAAAGTNVGAGATPGPEAPGSLGDVSSFQSAADKANKASETLNQLGLVGLGGLSANGTPRGDLSTLVSQHNPGSSSGANALSASLIGSAGRRQFDALDAQFNPTNDLNKAVVQSGLDAKAAADARTQAIANANTGAAAGKLVQSGAPAIGSTGKPPPIPDSVTTVDQAIASGYSPDQIVAKFGYAAYSDSVGAASHRGSR
jgi:hypothetical protein